MADGVTDAIPVFDGHNDTLKRPADAGPDAAAGFLHGDGAGHLDLPRARRGGFAGGLFACFVHTAGGPDAGFRLAPDGYTVDMPDPPSLANAQTKTDAMVACARRLQAEAPEHVTIYHDAAAIRDCMASGHLAVVLHLEGAEAIDPQCAALPTYYRAGIRSIGPVWSRPNAFGTGVPFRYPASPDIGPGLTAAGRTLVAACNEIGVLLDVSHLNAAGF